MDKNEVIEKIKEYIDESEWEYNNWNLIYDRREECDDFKDYGKCYKYYCYQVDLILDSSGDYVQAEPHL